MATTKITPRLLPREIQLVRIPDDTEQLIQDEIAAVRLRVHSLKTLAALVTRTEANRRALRDELSELVDVAQRCRAELSKPVSIDTEELLVRRLVASRNPSLESLDSPPHHQGMLSPLPAPPPPPPPEFPSASP